MKKILLLDDNLEILQVVEEVLAYEQFEVKAIDKSVGFLTEAAVYQPDLIILDYKLRDGNGGDLCRSIKKHGALKHIPVIIFSAYTQAGLNFFDYGCDEVINKPFNIDHLIKTVNSLTSKQNDILLPAV